MEQKKYTYDQLLAFTVTVFEKIGCSVEDASVAAVNLLNADLRGIDSHGIARLSSYIRLWEAGRINAVAQPKIIHETPSTAVVDGDAGLGLVVAPFAMKAAITKAKSVGTGWVAVQNSNHFGIAGQYAMMALEHDMIGIATTNASAIVAPTHSKEKMLGTNPIAFAVPAGVEYPFIADFATTTASNGKLELLQRKNQSAPNGWVQDADGNPVTDAHILKRSGALLPLGSDIMGGSHKGFMLGSIVDILSGVLGGGNYGPWVPPLPAYLPLPEGMPGNGIGHFFGAMRIDAFGTSAEFKKNMDKWIARFRSAEPINTNQKVIIPGDPEREAEAFHKENGITLHPEVKEGLKSLAEKFSVFSDFF